MKKLIVFILSFVYIVASSGATLHLHYCMGKLVQLGLQHESANNCENCGMSKKSKAGKNCCKDEHKLIKSEKDQKLTANTLNQILLAGDALTTLNTQLPEVFVYSAILENPSGNAPPRSGKVDPYILNCTFLI